ncbi:hypothetical protein S7W_01395 [Mycobacteroides abscessus M94]|nr:hypothetical protein S7W_01395 [Mycobacteroides abscessus M94]
MAAAGAGVAPAAAAPKRVEQLQAQHHQGRDHHGDGPQRPSRIVDVKFGGGGAHDRTRRVQRGEAGAVGPDHHAQFAQIEAAAVPHGDVCHQGHQECDDGR